MRGLTVAATLLAALIASGCGRTVEPVKPERVRTGLEVLISERAGAYKGQRAGLLTHPAGVDFDLRSSIDLLRAQPDIRLVALFSPEHGIRGVEAAGEKVDGGVDSVSGLPVRSLYGKTRKPTRDMLADIDVLFVDLQDIGSRSYTYISTLYHVMEAAAEYGKKVVVLDRPNPLGGEIIDGPVLDPAVKSFIGIAPIPVVHGMTIGELALLFDEEFGIHCGVEVVPMKGWRRGMRFRETGLPWVPTSPHIPTEETPLYYPVTGMLGEMGTLYNGVGMPQPFRHAGAPWMDGQKFISALPPLPGVKFRPLTVKPFYFTFQGQTVHGAEILIHDPKQYRPVEAALHILWTIHHLWPADFRWHPVDKPELLRMVDSAWGTADVRKMIDSGAPAEAIIASWQPGLNKFKRQREKYLIYKP